MSRKRTAAGVLLLMAVTTAGGFALGRSTRSAAPRAAAAPATPQVYTCSMHPQVRMDRPGTCPICAMPLVPEKSAGATTAAGAPVLELSDHALAMASVETTPVERRELSRELRTVGKVQYNESSLATVTARVDGYAEKLFVNFTGVEIKAGDHLAEIYSPALHSAQHEVLIAVRDGLGAMAELSKLKLKRWGLTDEQVARLVERNQVTDRVTLYSPISGTVIEKSVVENSSFEAGDALYRVANLDTVWVYLDVYEYDLASVRFGQTVALTAEALPGRVFTGTVTFVQPLVDDQTRTVRVPVHVDNADHALRPGMFVSAVVRAPLDESGRAAPTGVEGKFSCVMHPQVVRDGPGDCPVCRMPLERIPGGPPADAKTHDGHADAPQTRPAPPRLPLAVPATALLDSGTRRIVYVERSRGLFEPREVVVGPRSGAYYPVLDGLSAGDRVVTRGAFLVDSQFQITGKSSLFYPGGLTAGAGAHRHGGDAPAGADPPPPAAPAAPAPGHKH